MAKLVDQTTGEERQLVKPITLIGRADYCDICLRDRLVSREHARIRRRLLGYYVEDLGSTHGTRVNDVRVRRRARLHDGDLIAIAIVAAETRGASALHPPHADTAPSSHKTPPGREPTGRDAVRVGASFIFRK